MSDDIIEIKYLDGWLVMGWLARVVTLVGGWTLTNHCIAGRFAVKKKVEIMQWSSGALEISNGYQELLAWSDLYNMGMYAGVAIILIAVFGWNWERITGRKVKVKVEA